MELLYVACAVVGGAVLILQFLLLAVGGTGDVDVDVGDVDVGGDVDVDTDGGDSSDAAFKVVSVKTLIAFVTFFGLGGCIGGYYELGTLLTLALAVALGTVALFVVAWVWSLLFQLQSSGNVRVEGAIGKTGRVYLRVPPSGEGHGKVTVEVQGRTLELRASTSEDSAIPTGDQVIIVDLVAPETVSVVRAV